MGKSDLERGTIEFSATTGAGDHPVIHAAIKGIPICCPRCKRTVATNYACGTYGIIYPVGGARPILIHETNSVFRTAEIQTFSFMGMDRKPSLGRRLLPSPDSNVASKRNYKSLVQQLPPPGSHPGARCGQRRLGNRGNLQRQFHGHKFRCVARDGRRHYFRRLRYTFRRCDI